jgi:hypothetical protein
MKRQVLIAALVLLTISTALAQTNLPPKGKYKHDKKIEASYDKFKDETTISLKSLRPLPIIHPVTLYIVPTFRFPGKTVSLPDHVSLWFYSTSKDWQFLDYRQLLVVADGERFDFGETARVQSNVDANRYTRHVNVSETLGVMIPLNSFLKIINSKSVEIRLGQIEFKLAPDHLEALRDFASRMQP